MRHSVYQRAKRLTAHQQRMRSFEELTYQTLRNYQDGRFDAVSGVGAGQLPIPLTTVLDHIKEHANLVFGLTARKKASK